ncbi:unnamed protein product [Jaminaea pallidilutea]
MAQKGDAGHGEAQIQCTERQHQHQQQQQQLSKKSNVHRDASSSTSYFPPPSLASLSQSNDASRDSSKSGSSSLQHCRPSRPSSQPVSSPSSLSNGTPAKMQSGSANPSTPARPAPMRQSTMSDSGRGDESDQRRSAPHSRQSSREYRETLDARTSNEKDGSKVINQYRLAHVLGQGAYSVVYYGHLRDNASSQFAVKELSKTRLQKSKRYDRLRRPPVRGRQSRGGSRPGSASGRPNNASGSSSSSSSSSQASDSLELIRRELAIMKKLDHPNVISLFEVLDDPSRDELYMVVEYCPDGPVFDVKLHEQRQPLSESVARDYFVQILLGIEYLHSNDIVHQDIKPDNILLCNDRRTCKIVDFGVSEMFGPDDKVADEEDGPRPKAQGTAAFLSPERCSAGSARERGSSAGKDNAGCDASRESNGRRDDLWAVGVTLYSMVVGHLPFDKDNFMEMYEAIRSEEPDYPSYLSADCVDLLQAFLHKDVNRRISVDQAREHPWVTKRGSEPILSAARNLEQVVQCVTEDEIKWAICRITSIFTIARAVSKFKRAGSRNNVRSPSQSSTDGLPSAMNSPQSSFSLPPGNTSCASPVARRASSGETGNKATSVLSHAMNALSLPSADQCNSPPPLIEEPEKESNVEEEQNMQTGHDGGQKNMPFSSPLRQAGASAAAGAATAANALKSLVGGSEGREGNFSSRDCSGKDGDKDAVCNAQPSFCDDTSPHTSTDALSQALHEFESRLEHRMHSSDAIAAAKHLANRLQQATPLHRLEKGLKGMGLPNFALPSSSSSSRSSEASESRQDEMTARQSGSSSEAVSHQEVAQNHDGDDTGSTADNTQSDSRTTSDTGRVKGSYYDEDDSGHNIRTGRSDLHGKASSGVKLDRRDKSQRPTGLGLKGASEGELDDDSHRLFSGPMIASPVGEGLSREAAAKELGAPGFGTGNEIDKKSTEESGTPADGDLGSHSKQAERSRGTERDVKDASHGQQQGPAVGVKQTSV